MPRTCIRLFALLLLLLVVLKGKRRFDGQIMWSYFLWYGFGRGLIEGLRTDSLYFFHTPIRVSQLLGFASALVAAGFLIYHLFFRRHKPEELCVNRVRAAEKAARAEQVEKEENEHGGDGH